ncbi:MAG TPA: VOC family protein [Rudaea sp.]|jgi:catechol 2,3-dioxygenase-like lactoylglutathione lyase family enzyme|nr:VOC family protein [Rudaea sp.]
MTTARVVGIDRLCLVSADVARFTAFYQSAFDARLLSNTTIAIGNERIELITFDEPGMPYPADAIASDVTFQHFAIVVTDMEAAYARLGELDGWRPISRGGPQRLPANTGGVTAFKFRDPEGHPLELLEFPPDAVPARWKNSATSSITLGIDHTAMSVADVDASIAFYASLGFHVSNRSTNRGVEQDRLDGIDGLCVEVIALSPPESTPHLELLCYAMRRSVAATGPHDIAATRVVLTADNALGEMRDPDGHRLIVSAIE